MKLHVYGVTEVDPMMRRPEEIVFLSINEESARDRFKDCLTMIDPNHMYQLKKWAVTRDVYYMVAEALLREEDAEAIFIRSSSPVLLN